MTNLSVFNFESHEVRFIEGKPVGNDIAAVLGYADPSKAVSTKVATKNKGVTKAVTPGGVQSITVLKEAGIYQLIFGSKLPSAEKFQDWVFEEVLPTIRKTGTYAVNGKTSEFKTKVAELDGKRRELKQRIDAALLHLKQLESEYSQLDVEMSKLYVLNNHEIGEEYIKHKQKIEVAKASVYLPKGK